MRRTFASPISVLLSAMFAFGCSGPVLERLDGEPKSTWTMTKPRTRREKPVVAGLKRFVDAAQKRDTATVYRHLSALTKRALKLRAKAIGKDPIDLLRPAKAGSTGDKKVHIGDPLVAFVLPDIVRYEPGPDPYPAATPADGRTVEQRVTVTSRNGSKREITMRFEGLDWRVHNPTFDKAGGASK